jgi:hypothetical protein
VENFLVFDKCKSLSKEIVLTLRGSKNDTGALSIWWPICFGEIKTAQDVVALFDVSISTAKRWIAVLREYGFIRTIDQDSVISEVVMKANLIHCHVSIESKTTTNKHTKDFNINLNDNASLNDIDYHIFERVKKIETISIKIASMFNSSTNLKRQVSRFEIYNILDYWFSDQKEVNEILAIQMASYCLYQFDNPSARPLLEDGRPDIIQNLVGYYAGCLSKRLAGKVYWMEVERKITINTKGNKHVLESNKKDEFLRNEYDKSKNFINDFYGESDEKNTFYELFNVSEKAIGFEKTVILSRQINELLQNKYYDLDGYRYKIYLPHFVEAITYCIKNIKPYLRYIFMRYLTISDNHNHDVRDMSHISWIVEKEKQRQIIGN